ncbi:MAG TPA: proline iminopeptidase, partial [Puia sp.]|nr:proline iminopeptidase [Puia sp.]
MKKSSFAFAILIISIIINSCSQPDKNSSSSSCCDYLNSTDTGIQVAGIKMIPIETPVGKFKVWTKRFGNNPTMKVLL